MPLTPAERQKLYRERLKKNNPGKFLLQKKKNAERTKNNRKKFSEYSASEQKNIRKEWRERKNKSKKDKPKVNKPKENEPILKLRKVVLKLQKENKELKCQQEKWKNTARNLRKKLRRSIENKNKLMELLKQKDEYIEENFDYSTTEKTENKEEMTPLSKTNAYMDSNLPDIPLQEKERVKRTLLEHNVLVETIKEAYQNKNTQEKRVIKDIFKCSDTLKKYNLKTKIATYLGLKGKIRHSLKKTRNRLLLDHLKDFYERDDVSRMTAGKNETKTKKKQKMQRRYLLGTLRKLYKKYTIEGGKLSYSTFKKYRPFYVLPPKTEKRDTCACKRHENLQMKANVLKEIGVLATKDLDELLEIVVCEKSKKCCYGDCELCRNKRVDIVMGDNNLNDSISWSEWTLNTHEYKPKKNVAELKTTKRVDKESKTGSLKSLIDTFQDELQEFKIHSFNIIHQYKEYRLCTKNLDNRTIALHIDFSENYSCKLAKEIQSMHFDGSRQQITIHTGILYSEKGKQSFASMSSSKDHSPEAIWAHLVPVLKLIKEKFPLVDGIHFHSDGPTVQYRQKKNFYYFSKLTRELGFPYSTWNFFEAAHGKGAADGVGGAIKRSLDAFVAYGTDVPDAKTAFDLLQQSETTIKLFYIPEESIITECIDLVPVPKTMKLHQIINNLKMDNAIFYRELSCFCEKGLPRRGFCDCLGLTSAVLLKQTSVKNENTIKPINTRKILSGVNNSTHQTDIQNKTTASTSKGKGVGKKSKTIQTVNKKDESKVNEENNRNVDNLQEGMKRRNSLQIENENIKRRKTEKIERDLEEQRQINSKEREKHHELINVEKNVSKKLYKYEGVTIQTEQETVASQKKDGSKIRTKVKSQPASDDEKIETIKIEDLQEDTNLVDKTTEKLNVENLDLLEMPILFADDYNDIIYEEVEITNDLQNHSQIMQTEELKINPPISIDRDDVINTEVISVPEIKKEISANKKIHVLEDKILKIKSKKNKLPKKNYYNDGKGILKILKG